MKNKVLRDMYELLGREGGWCQHKLALNRHGKSVDPRSASAVSWCLYGAFLRGTGLDIHDPVARAQSLHLLGKRDGRVIKWNDAYTRTQRGVLRFIMGRIAVVERRAEPADGVGVRP